MRSFTINSATIWRVVQLLLLLSILALLLWSKPWTSTTVSEQRKLVITGQSTITASPDEYAFSPYFEKTGSDAESLKTQVTKQANQLIAKLKELNVPQGDIQLDVSTYGYDPYLDGGNDENTVSAYINVKVDNQDLAQKVQDYLVTTDAKGQLSPSASFSQTKQDELQKQATEQAIKDAKDKAQSQADQLGIKVGKVLEYSQSNLDYPVYFEDKTSSDHADDSTTTSLPVLSGQQDYTQAVTVTFEIK